MSPVQKDKSMEDEYGCNYPSSKQNMAGSFFSLSDWLLCGLALISPPFDLRHYGDLFVSRNFRAKWKLV